MWGSSDLAPSLLHRQLELVAADEEKLMMDGDQDQVQSELHSTKYNQENVSI